MQSASSNCKPRTIVMASFVITRTVLKDIGIGSIVDNRWRIESYSHTGANAVAVQCDKSGNTTAPFTRVMLIHSDNDSVIEQKA